MLKSFVRANIRSCDAIDGALGLKRGNEGLIEFLREIRPNDAVADVGGGKKPAKVLMGMEALDCARYDGLDFDEEELILAQRHYTEIAVYDLTSGNHGLDEKYDKVICRNTLEHVRDDVGAMAGLASLVKPGGQVYVKVPYRNAIFAILNRMIPHQTKRKVLHAVFPAKIGDGFPAYYSGCSISRISENAVKAGLTVRPERTRKIKSSTYFMFFVPAYAVWRLGTVIQQMLDRDYCEQFEMILEKPMPGTPREASAK